MCLNLPFNYISLKGEEVFNIKDDASFKEVAIEVYYHQRRHNPVYKEYCDLLGIDEVNQITEIPFLPISFYKSHRVTSQKINEAVFTSSGTTGDMVSQHYVSKIAQYDLSLDKSFEQFFGNHKDYLTLALLPHYLDRKGSSLVYMAQRWIEKSQNPNSGYYLRDLERLSKTLQDAQRSNQKTILIGVTFALLQLAEKYPATLSNTLIIETGGMKGMRREMIKDELHHILTTSFPKAQIMSEYGMTELLSQAYAIDGVNFITPSWMQVLAREVNDPLSLVNTGSTGGLNIIDLANYDSCSFIATQDLGKINPNGTFQVLGRFDQSDIRGCNLMAVE
ncbi:MAG: acyl transferase [Nonlabens sp.]